METQNVDPKPHKRIRRRKKRKINEIRQQMEFYFSDANLSKDRYLKQLVANDPSKYKSWKFVMKENNFS